MYCTKAKCIQYYLQGIICIEGNKYFLNSIQIYLLQNFLHCKFFFFAWDPLVSNILKTPLLDSLQWIETIWGKMLTWHLFGAYRDMMDRY